MAGTGKRNWDKRSKPSRPPQRSIIACGKHLRRVSKPSITSMQVFNIRLSWQLYSIFIYRLKGKPHIMRLDERRQLMRRCRRRLTRTCPLAWLVLKRPRPYDIFPFRSTFCKLDCCSIHRTLRKRRTLFCNSLPMWLEGGLKSMRPRNLCW